MLLRVCAAGAGDVGVIAAKDPRIYFNCGCVLRVRAEYELAFILKKIITPIKITIKIAIKIIPTRSTRN